MDVYHSIRYLIDVLFNEKKTAPPPILCPLVHDKMKRSKIPINPKLRKWYRFLQYYQEAYNISHNKKESLEFAKERVKIPLKKAYELVRRFD